MTSIVKIPFLGANDTEAELLDWIVQSGTAVREGDGLCILETTKATIEVSANTSGYFFHAAEEGATVTEGTIIGYIDAAIDFDVANYEKAIAEVASDTPTPTKKAELLMARHGITPEDLRPFHELGTRIGEKNVQAYLEQKKRADRRIGRSAITRVAILGGASGGGALIVIDALRRLADYQAVRIYEQDARFHGTDVLGVPVVGTMDQLANDQATGLFNEVVIAFNRNLEERDRVFRELKIKGYSFANVIDPSVTLRSQVRLGVGNVILANTYIGACSEIGDNNFISANVALEHGNILGDSCAFGPGVFTSGNVTIGDRVRFGTGVFVEPTVTIGSDAVIGSGNTVISDVRPAAMLTTHARI